MSASRNTTLQADQVVFAVSVSTDMTAGLSDVLAAVESAGITQANLVGVSSGQLIGILEPVGPGAPLPQPQPRLQWTFGVPVAIAKIKDMASALTDLQHNLTQVANGPRLSFTVQGTQVSQQLQQSQTCSVADLISDARAQAQKLASAAGLSVGNVLAMSSTTSSTSLGGVVYLGLSLGPFFSPANYAAPLTVPCYVLVKFALR